MKPSSLEKAKSEIAHFFELGQKDVFDIREMSNILLFNRDKWKIAKSTSFKRFISFITTQKVLAQADFAFPNRRYRRFLSHSPSILSILSTLDSRAYFSHYTSMHIHELTEQIPKTIFLNIEQSPKKMGLINLSQERIDNAFRLPWRVSKNIAKYQDYTVFILNGKFTDNLGTIKYKEKDGAEITFTDLERTLIDIAVRPVYAGGVFEVLKAYRASVKNVDIKKIISYLEILKYIYPYHQVVGFFLEKSGFPGSEIKDLERLGLVYDFYITHEMRNMAYSKKWRLYYPEGF